VTRESKRSRILVIVQDWAALLWPGPDFDCAFLPILRDSASSGMRTLRGSPCREEQTIRARVGQYLPFTVEHSSGVIQSILTRQSKWYIYSLYLCIF